MTDPAAPTERSRFDDALPTLDADTAQAFGFDATGRDGDPRFPHTRFDAVTALYQHAGALIDDDALTVHDGGLPYVYEIVRTTTDPAYARMLRELFPDLIEQTGTGYGISEAAFNIDAETGRIDPTLPLTAAHVQLHHLLTLITVTEGLAR